MKPGVQQARSEEGSMGSMAIKLHHISLGLVFEHEMHKMRFWSGELAGKAYRSLLSRCPGWINGRAMFELENA